MSMRRSRTHAAAAHPHASVFCTGSSVRLAIPGAARTASDGVSAHHCRAASREQAATPDRRGAEDAARRCGRLSRPSTDPCIDASVDARTRACTRACTRAAARAHAIPRLDECNATRSSISGRSFH
eukprot:6181264-Pleurochrysis_carterae.AAC.1